MVKNHIENRKNVISTKIVIPVVIAFILACGGTLVSLVRAGDIGRLNDRDASFEKRIDTMQLKVEKVDIIEERLKSVSSDLQDLKNAAATQSDRNDRILKELSRINVGSKKNNDQMP